MPRPTWILLCVLALGAAVLTLAWIEEPPGLNGRVHPELPSMRQGGDGLERHGPILLGGWLFGCAIILCFGALIRFGAVRRPARKRLATLLSILTGLYLAAWSWLVWAYRGSLEAAGLSGAGPDLILTLPRPTAIMIFVFWPVSMLFGVVFVVGFDRWVLTEEQEAAFERLVASRASQTGRAEADDSEVGGAEASDGEAV